MPFSHAKLVCPDLIRCSSRPSVYAQVSHRLMDFLRASMTPDIEIFSVDEAFLDVTKVHGLPKCPYALASAIQSNIKILWAAIFCGRFYR